MVFPNVALRLSCLDSKLNMYRQVDRRGVRFDSSEAALYEVGNGTEMCTICTVGALLWYQGYFSLVQR